MARLAHKVLFGNTVPTRLTLERGAPPPWLLSSYESLEWTLKEIGKQKNRIIYWDVSLGRHGRLPQYPHLLATVKAIVYGLRTGPYARMESAGAQYQAAQDFFNVIKWMLDRGRSSFSELTRRDIEEYKHACAAGVDSLLNAQAKVRKLVEEMVVAAGFQESDTREARMRKSLAVFPHRAAKGQFRLERYQLLESLGLGFRSEGVATILDGLENDCGFYMQVNQRERLAASVQAKTQAEADAADGDEDEEEELDKQPLDKVTGARAKSLLLPLTYLYTHRKYCDDALAFHPFSHAKLATVLRSLSLRDVRRTPTAPVEQTITLIERSARWVLDYAPQLLALQRWARRNKEEPGWRLNELVRQRTPSSQGPGSPFPIVRNGRDSFEVPLAELTASAVALRKGMSLRSALSFLQTACIVIIAAFTARRAAEIRSLMVGCIQRDDLGKPWLRCFIHKTLRDYTLIPVPEIVVKAVEVLTRLSKSARDATRTEYLLQLVVPVSGEVVGINDKGEPVLRFAAALEKFGYFLDVPALEDGTRWAFAPHQFRRFFAVMYIWAYDYGDIDALSYHLRHWNRNQTRRYCTEQQVGREVSAANRERAAEMVAAAALGEVKFDGHPRIVKAVERMCHRMARRVQVVTHRQLAARALRFMERGKVTMHAFPWGACVTTEEGGEAPSRCNPDGAAALPDKASVATCTGCQKVMRGLPHRAFIVGSIQVHRTIVSDQAVPSMMREASAQMLEFLESTVPVETGP